MQKLLGNGTTVGRCFLCCPPRGYITPVTSCQSSSRTEAVQLQLSDGTVTGSSAPDTFEYNSSFERDTAEYNSGPGVD
jgi:hypothetical protein